MHAFSPLLQTSEKEKADEDASPLTSTDASDATSFPLRIKLNNRDITLTVNTAVSVATLKQWILEHHAKDGGATTDNGDMYLRLIVRGRLMAPDTATLDNFNVSNSDVVHAVLAKEGRGAQARMLRRLNNNNNSNTGSSLGSSLRRNFYSNPTNSESLNRLWRRIGIDASGVVVSRNGESDSEESEEEDVEAGGEGGNNGRRGRDRRGFDRLRSVSVMYYDVMH
jgi:hypothetical protein